MKLFAWNNVNTTTYENSFWVCITAKYIQSKAIVCVKGNHHYISSFTIVTLIFLLSLGNGYSYFSFKYLKKKRISVFLCFFFLDFILPLILVSAMVLKFISVRNSKAVYHKLKNTVRCTNINLAKCVYEYEMACLPIALKKRVWILHIFL